MISRLICFAALACAVSGSIAQPAEAPTSGRPSGLEIVAALDGVMPGNIAVTPQGRIVFSVHPFGAGRYRVMELMPNGTTEPFPNDEWASPAGDDGVGISAIIGIESDANGVVWMLDMGQGLERPARLIGWDTVAERLHRVIPVPAPSIVEQSFVQDLAIDQTHQAIYLADMGRADLFGPSVPAIIVVDIRTGLSRRVLEGHPSLQPEDVDLVVDGAPIELVQPDGSKAKPRLGLNPITLSADDSQLIVGSMSGNKLWTISTEALVDRSRSTESLERTVVEYGSKAPSDGITIDAVGNVYVTDLAANAIGVYEPYKKEYRLLLQDDLLSWPDGLSAGSDGYIYATVNQLHRTAALSGQGDVTEPPFLIVRFRPLAPALVGR